MSEPNRNLENALNTNLLTARIIVGMLATFVILTLGAFTALGETWDKPLSKPRIGIVGPLAVAGVALAVVVVVPKVAVPMVERRVARSAWSLPWWGPEGKFTGDASMTFRWWVLYLLVLSNRCALLGGAAGLQVVAYFTDRSLFSLGLGLGLLAVLLYQWPSRERVDRWVEARREAVERLQRGESP
jgi:hypothetical protein